MAWVQDAGVIGHEPEGPLRRPRASWRDRASGVRVPHAHAVEAAMIGELEVKPSI